MPFRQSCPRFCGGGESIRTSARVVVCCGQDHTRAADGGKQPLETILAGLALAAISGLTVLAYREPRAFEAVNVVLTVSLIAGARERRH